MSEDRHHGSTLAFVEAERRISRQFKVELESRWFLDIDPQDLLAFAEQDSFLTARLTWSF